MATHGDGDDRRRWTRVAVNGGALGRSYLWGTAPVLEGGPILELRAGVVRSYVHGLEPVASGETRVRYRAAVQFRGITEEERALLRERLSCGADAGA